MIVLYGDEVKLLLDNEMATIKSPMYLVECIVSCLDGDYDERWEIYRSMGDWGYITFCKDLILLETESNRRIHYGEENVRKELEKMLTDLELVIERWGK